MSDIHAIPGQKISRTLYPDLFAAMATVYGTWDGAWDISKTFNLPENYLANRGMADSSESKQTATKQSALAATGKEYGYAET